MSSDKSISAADLGKMTNFAYYDHYEIRITMRREHSAALKYTTAGQRLEPTLVAPYNGLRPLKQRKPVSRESILTQISLKSSIRNYDTTHTRILPRPANLLQQLLVTWKAPADTSGRSGSVAEVAEVDGKLPAAVDSIVANPQPKYLRRTTQYNTHTHAIQRYESLCRASTALP